MDAHAHFASLARYNVWATARLLKAVEAVPRKTTGAMWVCFSRASTAR